MRSDLKNVNTQSLSNHVRVVTYFLKSFATSLSFAQQVVVVAEVGVLKRGEVRTNLGRPEGEGGGGKKRCSCAGGPP